mmetsp:Transcript_9135/g.28462  ORF Transcript_9135/g.28462 Transcript_9135/m.28462 type:complete len:217 (+) Transcript_9135:187-837(+)
MSQWGALDAKYSTGAGAKQRVDVPTCQQCLNGQCRRHPKQDHGRSAARLQAEAGAQASGTLDRMYDALVAPQIAKAKKDLGDFDEKAEREYAASAAKDREKALKRKRKGLGEEGQRLAASGLHGGVVGLMTRSDDDSSSSSSSSSSGDKKRRKKEKKKLKKKAKKALKKEKKRKKKEKKRRKKESDASSSAASDGEVSEPRGGTVSPPPPLPVVEE